MDPGLRLERDMARLCSSSGEMTMCFGVRLYECGSNCFWRNELLPLRFWIEAGNPFVVMKACNWRTARVISDVNSGLAAMVYYWGGETTYNRTTVSKGSWVCLHVACVCLV